MTITYGSADFALAMKGVTMVGHPPQEQSATETHGSEEFAQFSEVAEKLVQVPKEEVDEMRRSARD
jgi:hypothetical protein